MNKPDKHINDIIRQKFESFEPTPPEHIWKNIEKSLDNVPKSGFLSGKGKILGGAILLLISIPLAYYFINNFKTNNSASVYNNIPITQSSMIADASINTEKDLTVEENINIANESNIIDIDIKTDDDIELNNIKKEYSKKTPQVYKNTTADKVQKNTSNSDIIIALPKIVNTEIQDLGLFGLKDNFYEKSISNIQLLNKHSIRNISSSNYGSVYSNVNSDIFMGVSQNKTENSGHWENTIYISPEFSLTNLDSITILNSYAIGFEPTKYFNDHLFIRFGLDLSFSGDKGFAKIDYLSNELMGSYDDVYNVTFDTIGGNVTPIYHTKTVEVWDSIRQIGISEVSNKYLFAQLPIMMGYKNKLGNLNWYVFGGPAFGFQIASWIDKPKIDGKEIEIINLNSKLPLRSTFNYQVWLGGGIEYNLNSDLSIVIEPTYKYYFKSLYNNENYKVNTSGFSIRLGFNYKIGH